MAASQKQSPNIDPNPYDGDPQKGTPDGALCGEENARLLAGSMGV